MTVVVAEGIKLGEIPSCNTQALADGHNDDWWSSIHPFLKAVSSIIFSCVLHNTSNISALHKKTTEINPLYYRIMFSACFDSVAKCGPLLSLRLFSLIILPPETLIVDSTRNAVVWKCDLGNYVNRFGQIFLFVCFLQCKAKAIPLQAWTGPEGSRRLRLLDFKTFGTWRC